MKCVLASYGTRGDIEPSVVVARELQRRGHDMVMAVPPDSVGFTEAAGLTAVPYGLESQTWLDVYRNFWTSFFRGFWKIQEMRGMWREMWDLSDQCWAQMNTTLMSLADGADLLFAGQSYQETAANVAEFYDLPLATLHHVPMRPNGQVVSILPPPLARSAMTAFDWYCWRLNKRSRTPSAANSGCRRRHRRHRGGSPSADHWKSRPMTRPASPGWPMNGRNGMACDRSSER